MCKPTNTYWKYFQLFEASLELLVHIWVDGRKSPSFLNQLKATSLPAVLLIELIQSKRY